MTVDGLLARGTADVDELAAWRVAELRAVGVQATVEIREEKLAGRVFLRQRRSPGACR